MKVRSAQFGCKYQARRGTILITTMAICFTLAAVVLVLCRKMAVEAVASANQAAIAQADTIERGGEQYCKALLTSASINFGGAQYVFNQDDFPEDYFAWVPCGEGWFCVIRPNYDDDSLPVYGFVDECSKIDLNYSANTVIDEQNQQIFSTQLTLSVPGMTDDVAAAIVDWNDPGEDPANTIGAETSYYSTLADGYYAKNRPYEAVEELSMVRGITHEMLYGDGTGTPIGVSSGITATANNAPNSANASGYSRGWYDLFTVNSYSPNPDDPAQPLRGRINVNTAPASVLYGLEAYGLSDTDVSTIISTRQQQVLDDPSDITWLQAAVANYNTIQQYVTGSSLRYSADILAISGNGRAFRRVQVVFDTQNIASGTLSIISRKDMTDQGWPLDPQILKDIRAGQKPQANAIFGSTSNGGTRP
ncbi:MAG TPA: type II secretion system protein GspK [Tepidisphaeraceae bacterium]|nr:type II secretion system protein GspK [Tepidisphaeraceae bacterium]